MLQHEARGTKITDRKVISRLLDTDQHEVTVQPKLKVGAVDDPLEREADVVAADVVSRMQSRRSDSAATIESGDTSPIGRMEDAFGADFSGVRLHTDSKAAELSRSVDARAVTHGRDIYFGEGQFRPETTEGQTLLAHELTHTVQQGAASTMEAGGDTARRSPLPEISRDTANTMRRWDLGSGDLDLSDITELRVLESGQQTYFAKDRTGKEIVIKVASVPIPLVRLAELVHKTVHDNTTVDSIPIDGTNQAKLAAKIADATVSSDQRGWAQAGARTGGDQTTAPGDRARASHAQQIGGGQGLVAMEMVEGTSARSLGDSDRPGKDGSDLRPMFESPQHMRSLGQMSVADSFTGNGDRLDHMTVNLGNWLVGKDESVILIDNMDRYGGVPTFKDSFDDAIPDALLDYGKDIHGTSERAVDGLLSAAARRTGDKNIKTWAEADGGWTKKFMVQDFERGAAETADELVKKFLTKKRSKSGRALKKSVQDLGGDDAPVDFWEILKARAQALKSPSKAQAMVARLRKRHAAAQKKKSRREKRRRG